MPNRPPRRYRDLPRAPFAELVRGAQAPGKEGGFIDLSRGDPDIPPPAVALAALRLAAVERGGTTYVHRYPPLDGDARLKVAICDWYLRERQIALDPETEVAVVPGTRAAIMLVMAASVETGDCIVLPRPGYPDYLAGAGVCGATVAPIDLTAASAFQPDWGQVEKQSPTLVVLNYPSNPTGACERPGTFEKAVDYCAARNAWLMHDFAYGFLKYEGPPARSVLSVAGARDVAVELWSASKIFGMAGWRIGFVLGNRQLVTRVKRLVDQYNGGVWRGFQEGLTAALCDRTPDTEARIDIYRSRRNLMLNAMREAEATTKPEGAFFIWAMLPRRLPVHTVAKELRIGVAPGEMFGARQPDWIRLALTASDAVIREAATRFNDALAGPS